MNSLQLIDLQRIQLGQTQSLNMKSPLLLDPVMRLLGGAHRNVPVGNGPVSPILRAQTPASMQLFSSAPSEARVLQELQVLASLSSAFGGSFPQASKDSTLDASKLFMNKKRDFAPSCRVEPFPERLHRLLTEVESVGRSDVISFIADDTFRIHNPLTFFEEVVPQYFRQSKLTSFKRQLKLYGFELITFGPNKGGYRHPLFSKKKPMLCRDMKRVAIKGLKAKELSTSPNVLKGSETTPDSPKTTDQEA